MIPTTQHKYAKGLNLELAAIGSGSRLSQERQNHSVKANTSGCYYAGINSLLADMSGLINRH